MTSKTCWVVTLGIPGMDNQSLGLAEALGFEVVQKFVQPVAPWMYIPSQLWVHPLSCYGPKTDTFSPPWPDVLIGTGRKTVAASLAVNRLSGGKTFTVRIQDPHIDPKNFDVIVTPEHDQCRGDNVILTRGALHYVTQQKLEQAGQHFGPHFSELPGPKIAVLIGGNNNAYHLTPEVAKSFANDLRAIVIKSGGSLLLTTSRRTGADVEAVLRELLYGLPGLIWMGEGENPYLGFLALADHIVVTSDSISMTTEACFTGKPVYVYKLPGGSTKFERFHQTMLSEGYTRPFTTALQEQPGKRLDDMSEVAAEVRQRMSLA
jgi:mitochondrial fission protein ELM1